MLTGAAYYNELDPFAAAWLRELIRAGLIADGAVDERSISDVAAEDVRGYRQCHWFAGIGGWSYALRLADWPDDRPVWTGSCPCQPFSAAGKAARAADPRHLWPAWFRLVRECRPPIVFGEQVASPDGLAWWDLVATDLEGAGYAVGAADLCGPCVGAWDIRQRVWFVAESGGERREGERLRVREGRSRAVGAEIGRRGEAGELADTARERQGDSDGGGRGEGICAEADGRGSADARGDGGLGDTDGAGSPGRHGDELRARADQRAARPTGDTFWGDAEWIPCRDGKWRPVKSSIFPLAARVSGRVGMLRGAGNSIKPQVAAFFIKAYLSLGR